MDTGTHIVVGLGLGGLAMIDPIVSSSTMTAIAVVTGTVLGSNAPDADAILRLKGNAAYIRNHRGITHSLPFLFIWTAVITALLIFIFGSLPVIHIALWVFLAVALHVFSDLFNTYGTQALRPFSDKWISWNIIHIFDPFIFASHVLALLLWLLHTAPAVYIFPSLYAVIVIYYVWKTIHHHRLHQLLPTLDEHHLPGEKYLLIPTFKYNLWHIVKTKTDGSYVLGELQAGKKLNWIDTAVSSDHEAVEISKQYPDIQSFLYFTEYAYADVQHYSWGYEVRWADVRYRHRKQYPFVAVVRLTKDYKIMGSYVGWISDKRIKKKFELDPS